MRKALFIASLLLAPAASLAGDAAAGKAKAATCIACHGAKGISLIPIYPNLAGQNAPYLEIAMKAYRDGQRTGPSAALMKPMVAALTDEDIANLAAYYSGL
ncbi:MAG: cytochrome c [Cellvibrionales bacterium]|nr:cytochrome c [Cellvibrionales bacterium]